MYWKILTFLFILVLITDTLPVHHALLQVLSMLLGPIAILTCGVLLIMLSERNHVRVIYSRLVDPAIGCFLFISYLLIIFAPSEYELLWLNFQFFYILLVREVMQLVLQAKPNGLQSDEIETTIIQSVC